MQFLVQTRSHIVIRGLCRERSNRAGVATQYTVFPNYMIICSLLGFRPFDVLAALNLIWIDVTVRFTNTIIISTHFSVTSLTITRMNVTHFKGLCSEDGGKKPKKC